MDEERRGEEEKNENKKRKSKKKRKTAFCDLRSHVHNIKQTLVFKTQLSWSQRKHQELACCLS